MSHIVKSFVLPFRSYWNMNYPFLEQQPLTTYHQLVFIF